MKLTEQAQQHPAEHWGALAAYFSMELTEPFWPALGFTTAREIGLSREAMRRMIENLRTQAARSPQALPDIRDWIFGGTQLDWEIEEIRSFLKLGIEFQSAHAAVPQLSGWQIAFTYFPERFQATLKEAAGAGAIEELIALRGARIVQKIPDKLSGWDAQICARHGWNPHDELGFMPLDELSLVQGYRNAEDMLRLAGSKLSMGARTALWQDAQALITELGVWMPGPLEPLYLKV
jgi:hypothetical protein